MTSSIASVFFAVGKYFAGVHWLCTRKNVEVLINTRLQPGDRWSGEGKTVLNGFLI
jgi:hypothetical protein